MGLFAIFRLIPHDHKCLEYFSSVTMQFLSMLDKNEPILSIEKLPFLFPVVQLSSFYREPQGPQS